MNIDVLRRARRGNRNDGFGGFPVLAGAGVD
jgi:hypothetical protein